MLRDYELPTPDLLESISRFNVDDEVIAIRQFRAISPDSFTWLIVGHRAEYVLYAEDYIPSLEHVEYHIRSTFSFIEKGQFVEVRNAKDFDKLSAVESASEYAKPTSFEDEMRPFTSDSGIDLVFLYKILEGEEEWL